MATRVRSTLLYTGCASHVSDTYHFVGSFLWLSPVILPASALDQLCKTEITLNTTTLDD